MGPVIFLPECADPAFLRFSRRPRRAAKIIFPLPLATMFSLDRLLRPRYNSGDRAYIRSVALPDSQETLDNMAMEIFELYRLIAIARSRRPAGPDDLSETEFLTLDLLTKEQPLTIGEIQKQIGVLPAQMSRIIRALEEQGGRGYVECNINPQDRRRINVTLTDGGTTAYQTYRSARLGSMHDILLALDPEDRLHLMRILREIRIAFERRLSS